MPDAKIPVVPVMEKNNRMRTIGMLNLVFAGLYLLFLVIYGIASFLRTYYIDILGLVRLELAMTAIVLIAASVCLTISGVQLLKGDSRGRRLVLISLILIAGFSVFDLILVTIMATRVPTGEIAPLFITAVAGGVLRSLYPLLALVLLPKS